MDFLALADDVIEQGRRLEARIDQASSTLSILNLRCAAAQQTVDDQARQLAAAADLCSLAWQALVRHELGDTCDAAGARAQGYLDETTGALTRALEQDTRYLDAIDAWVERCEADLDQVRATASVDGLALTSLIDKMLGRLDADTGRLQQALAEFAALEKAVSGYSNTVSDVVTKLKEVLARCEPDLQKAVRGLQGGLEQSQAALQKSLATLQSNFAAEVDGVVGRVKEVVDNVVEKPADKVISMQRSVDTLVSDLEGLKGKLENLMTTLLDDAKEGAGALGLVLDIADEVDRIVKHMNHIANKNL